MKIRFCREDARSHSPARVASFTHDVPELPTLAPFAGIARRRNQVVVGANQLEVVHVVKHRYPTRPQFPKNRRGEMVIDVSDVRNVRPELFNHLRDPFPRVGRVNGMECQAGLGGETAALLEIREGNEVAVVSRHRSAFIRHREQCGLVSSRPHQFHGFKQVYFRPAEAEVVLVAVQDSHKQLLSGPLHFRRVGENLPPKVPDFVFG